MPAPSVVRESPAERRARMARLGTDGRVALALALGKRHVEVYATANGLDECTARLALERRQQARRRASTSMDALLR